MKPIHIITLLALAILWVIVMIYSSEPDTEAMIARELGQVR